jgi:hypothetical protein
MTLSFMSMSENGRSLVLLHRYETRITRRFHQAVAELKALQNQRKTEEAEAARQNCQTNSPKPSKPATVITILPPKPSPDPVRHPVGPPDTPEAPPPTTPDGRKS